MLDFNQLSPLMRDLHSECVKLFYLLLPVLFALALTIQWFRRASGAVDFLGVLKRATVCTLLLVSFPEISDAIIQITEGVSGRIDQVQSLEKVIDAAKTKVDSYSQTKTPILLGFNDFILSSMTFLTFFLLYVAHYLTLALFHFFWFFYNVTAPLLILFHLFESTSQITTNLFRGMIEVACWKIIWAILGVMLMSLSIGQMYQVEGSYITVMAMNIIIAVAMILTPILVHALVGSGVHNVAPMLATTGVAGGMSLARRSVAISAAARSPYAFPKRTGPFKASGNPLTNKPNLQGGGHESKKNT